MPIPDFQALMLPLLELAGDGETRHPRETYGTLAQRFGLTEGEKREILPSGRVARYVNRILWARSYLTQAGLLESPKRGYFRITKRGRDVLAAKPSMVNIKFLEQFEDFKNFQQRRRQPTSPSQVVVTDPTTNGDEGNTPEEALQDAYLVLRENLAHELLRAVMDSSPAFFEQLVVDLLLRMGYGGSRQEAGEAIGRSGDEGIDGIIKEDRLGLDIIYVQAKRWESVVGRPDVQKFAGALQGQRARKGVFITTSTFSREAMAFAANIDTKIILIDGARLADLMIDHGVGVTTEETYEVKRIDSDYFPDD